MKMNGKRILILSLISLLFISSNCFAQGAVGVGGQTTAIVNPPSSSTDPMSDPRYVRCGADCIYNKANENISLQLAYMEKKLDFLHQSTVSGAEKRKLLGAFCPITEEVDSCVERYERIQQFWRVKVRSALAKNAKSALDLNCLVYDSRGMCAIEGAKPVETLLSEKEQQSEMNKLDQVPTFLKAPEVLKKFENANQGYDSKLATLDSTISNNDWDGFLTQNYAPSIDDFIKFKTVFKDSDHPELGTTSIPMIGPDGKLVHDQEAYQKARRLWDSLHQEAVAALKGNSNLPQAVKQEKDQFLKDFAPQPGGAKSDRNQIYDNARGMLVDAANQDFGASSSSSSLNLPGPRNLSPTQNKNQTPSQMLDPSKQYTGNEEVKIPRLGGRNRQNYSISFDPTSIPDPSDTSSTESQIENMVGSQP